MSSNVQARSSLSYVEVTEQKRLNEAREAGVPWKKWGPYLSERQWGTVREDYSSDGNAWNTSPTTRPGLAPTAGEKMGWRESPMTNSTFASPWRCGTDATQS